MLDGKMNDSEIPDLIVGLIQLHNAMLFGKLPSPLMPGYTEVQRKIPDVQMSHEGWDIEAWGRGLCFSFQRLLSQSLLIPSCLVLLKKCFCVMKNDEISGLVICSFFWNALPEKTCFSLLHFLKTKHWKIIID